MRDVNEIIIHCTATRANWMIDNTADEVVTELRRWHVEDNGWSDCGYHHVITRAGEVSTARPEDRSGAHCRGKNKRSIGVTLCGGRGGQEDDAFEDNFSAAQESALRGLIRDLKERYPNITKISGHNEYAAKACPCFQVSDWLV